MTPRRAPNGRSRRRGEQDAPLLLRVRAQALAKLGRLDEARAAFDRALALAEEEGADLERALVLSAIARTWPDDHVAAEGSATAAKLLERLGVVAIAEPLV